MSVSVGMSIKYAALFVLLTTIKHGICERNFFLWFFNSFAMHWMLDVGVKFNDFLIGFWEKYASFYEFSGVRKF